MNWKTSSWLFIDTETTGFKASEGARVIELGWALVKNLKVVKTGNWLLNPGVEVPEKITQITGIKQEDLEGQPSFTDISHTFYNHMNSVDFMMAYNVKFDKPMIENEFKLAKVTMPDKMWLDPMIWVMRFLELGDHKLKTITQHFKIELDRAHRADADAEAAARAAIEFIASFEGGALPEDPKELSDLEKAWDTDTSAIRRSKYQSKIKMNKP